MARSWFKIKAQAGDPTKPVEMDIYDYIGYWGVNAVGFISEMKAKLNESGSKEILLSINSPGGSVFDAVAIFNALRNSGAKVTVRVLGIAASAASLIAMAGDKIIMPENTMMMIHNPLNSIYGNADEMREMADILDKVGTALIATYVSRTGLSEDDVKALLSAETYMTAAEAKEKGFCDEIETALTVTAAFELDNMPENVQALFKAAQKPEHKAPVETPPENAIVIIDAGATFASQMQALAAQAGMEDFVADWLLDAEITTLDQAQAILNEAVQVRELCNFAKSPDMAATFIKSRTSLVDARAQLCKARADASDNLHVDNTQPGADKKPPVSAPRAALKTADIYAARKYH